MSDTECLHPEKKVKRIIWKRSKEKPNGEDSAENGMSVMKMEGNVKKRSHSDPMTSDLDRPYMMSLLPLPNLEVCNSGIPIVLTGTACKGATGPPVGVVDIDVSKAAYYFRIALPGVKKDPGEFSCEIEKDGKVLIQGLTSTGGRTVSRYSRVFDMKIQQQCSSGHFTLSFSLPGPVDPRFFHQTSDLMAFLKLCCEIRNVAGSVLVTILSQNPQQKAAPPKFLNRISAG